MANLASFVAKDTLGENCFWSEVDNCSFLKYSSKGSGERPGEMSSCMEGFEVSKDSSHFGCSVDFSSSAFS